MITFLSKSQLAWILEISAEDARAKMCVAWAKEKNIKNTATWEETKSGSQKLKDTFPDAMPIEMLARQLTIPTLQQSVTDIEFNYLKRPATRKWILCDFPEKEIKAMEKAGKRKMLSIPKALRFMMSPEVRDEVMKEWAVRYPYDPDKALNILSEEQTESEEL